MITITNGLNKCLKRVNNTEDLRPDLSRKIESLGDTTICQMGIMSSISNPNLATSHSLYSSQFFRYLHILTLQQTWNIRTDMFLNYTIIESSQSIMQSFVHCIMRCEFGRQIIILPPFLVFTLSGCLKRTILYLLSIWFCLSYGLFRQCLAKQRTMMATFYKSINKRLQAYINER